MLHSTPLLIMPPSGRSSILLVVASQNFSILNLGQSGRLGSLAREMTDSSGMRFVSLVS